MSATEQAATAGVSAPATRTTAQPPGWRHRAAGASGRLWSASPLTYLALIIAIVLSAFPIIWSFIMASQPNTAVYQVPPPLLPGGELGPNLARAIANPQAQLLRGMVNSAIVAGTITVSVVTFSALAGFAFAKLRFRGRQGLLLVVVLTMMVPIQVAIVPLYLMMIELGWVHSLRAVIVPFLVSGFGVFLMRQYAISAVSDELIEAARVDGAPTWRIFVSIVVPALRPAMAVLGLLTFMKEWNEFLWPFVVLSPRNPTVQISLNTLATGFHSTDYSQVFAGTAIALIPLLAVFVLFGRQIIGGIMEGAVKG